MRGRSAFLAAALAFATVVPAQTASADSLAYLVTGSSQFGTVDLNTGVFTQLGSTGLLLSGLGVAGGNMYGGVESGSTLYRVNPATGALTAAGTGSISYAVTGSTTTGLYALSWPNFDLYSINPSNGAAALIGPNGLSHDSVEGLSTGSAALYYTTGTNLYTLNTATGAATLVGTTGTYIGATVFENGTLYGGWFNVYTLNPSTGAATLGTNACGNSGGFWGLAPYPLTATPEPPTVVLMGTALLGLAALVRRTIPKPAWS
jgi:hypothetical protein